MTHNHNEKNEDVNRILEYLTNDQEFDAVDVKNHKMDGYQEGLLSDSWPTYTEDLLENIFSLEEGSINLLDESMTDFTLTESTDNVSQLSQAMSSACSDSGLSSDQAEFDFEQQLSPFLIQNSCDDDITGAPAPLATEPCVAAADDGTTQPAYDAEEFERNVLPGFLNRDTFQSGKAGRKRRLSQTPPAVVQPKLQKPTVRVSAAPPTVQKPQLVVRAQQRPVKVANIQVISPQPKVYCKPDSMQHRKVIRVAPMAGNPRSILLPVTIKDMKDLKSIKIINAADLKNASNIRLAAANLLSQSKMQDVKMELSGDYEYETQSNNCDDSGTDDSDDDLPKERHDGKNGYPRLVLTAEERRLLTKEGISLPASYPLTKHEERELKRIRRKIRNKISAQDSRKRKKEYVDGLEDRVKQCTTDNQTLIRRIKILQSQNHSLTTQLKRLQQVLTSGGALPSPAGSSRAAPPATCLLVLLLSVALVALPSLQRERDRALRPPQQHQEAVSLKRALLSATTFTSLEETVIDDGEFHMDELIAFHRPHSDHDYQRRARAGHVGHVPRAGHVPAGYVDLPVDDDWPPNKKRMKTPEFDFEDGKDHLPIIKQEKYENALSMDSKLDVGLLGSNLLSISHKLGELMGDIMPPIPVKSEDIVIEEADDYDARNGTEVRSFLVNGTVSSI